MRAIINVSQTHHQSILNGYTFNIDDFNQRYVSIIGRDGEIINLGFSEIMIVDFEREYEKSVEINDVNKINMLKGFAIVNNIKINND